MELPSTALRTRDETVPVRIVVTSLGSFANRGVEALAQTCFAQLKKHIPNSQITALVRTPDYNRRRVEDSTIQMRADMFGTAVAAVARRMGPVGELFKKRFLSSLVEQERLVREADVVIVSGGDNFSSDYGSPEVHLRPLRHAQKHGVPVVFLAQSIGPFREQGHRNVFLPVARKAELITVRERISYDYVTQDLKLDPSRIEITADPAFLLPPASAEQVRQFFNYYGVAEDRPKTAIAVSQGICGFVGMQADGHFARLCQLIERLLQNPEQQILLVPHVEDSADNNDLLLANRLLRHFKFDRRIFITGLDHSASEFKGIIAACDMLVAERMHAAIAALSSGVCCVVIGYSIKGSGIMGDLLGSDPVREGLVIPLKDFIENDSSLELIQSAWQRREQIGRQLKGVLPAFKARAERNFELIAEVIKRKRKA